MELLFSYIILALSLTALIILISRTVAWRILHRNKESWVRMLLTVPSALINPFADHTPHEIAMSKELYARLIELNIPFALEAAVHSLGESIYFYVMVRKTDRLRVSTLIETLWSTGYLSEAEEYDMWLSADSRKGSVTAGYLTQVRPYSIPLRSARRGHFEPFLALLNTLSELKTFGEAASVQIVVKAAGEEIKGSVRASLAMLEKGIYKPHQTHEGFRITPNSLAVVREKVSSPLCAVNYRIAVVARHSEAKQVFKKIVSVIERESHDPRDQYNELAIKIPREQSDFMNKFLNATFDSTEEMILSSTELATYFHLPSATTAAPKIKR